MGTAAAAGWLVATACVLPPEGDQESFNVPPVVPSDGVFPDGPVLELAAGRSDFLLSPSIPPMCATTRIELEGVFDLDSDQVLTRVVANNGSDDDVLTPILIEASERRFGQEPGAAFDVVEVIDLAASFPNAVPVAARFGPTASVLTVFLTDAPEWSYEPGRDELPEDGDFGRIDADGGRYGVTQVDFPIVFLREDQCIEP
jgi:hypothetical protein